MLGYPFDADAIMQNKRTLKKQLLAQEGLLDKKIALLSGTTIGEIKNILELFLLDNGIRPTFFEGDYGRWFEDLVFDSGELSQFAPDAVFVHTGIHNLESLPNAGEEDLICEQKLDAAFEKLKTAWDASAKLGCPIIQNNFDYPRFRVMGNYEATAPSGSVRFVRRLNERMADYAYKNKMLYINDLNYLSARIGIDAFSDPSYYNAYKYALTPAYIPYLCHSVSNIIKSIFGKNKKVLMLDLDNTLWGGVIGDDGVDGIRLGTESPMGIAHLDMQKYASQLPKIGILLGVSSKNDEKIAKSGFSHPSAVLKEEDFSVFRANWEPKHLNIEAAAKQLNIGTDSFVFADDNPAEREIVRQAGLGVAVPELNAAEHFAETVAEGGWFEVTSLSEDDRKRTEMYRQNALREAGESHYSDYAAYLKSLEMKAYFSSFSDKTLERVTQLANKTNQFNLTTRRYQLAEMEQKIQSDDTVTLAGRLEDKFGDNGLVTEIVANIEGDTADIELWVMSCRVFKRNLEYAMFEELVRRTRSRGVTTITGHYLATAKNHIVAEFFETLGFEKIAQNGEDSDWRYLLSADRSEKKFSIEVCYE